METVELNPEIVKLRKHIKKLTRSEVNEELLQMYILDVENQRRIHELENKIARNHQSYMVNCRSSGGITLPPGM